jgi:pimeloyl-ACP methyl ester carboxylesterase
VTSDLEKFHTYLIPGIGADYRVFETIQLPGYETTVLKWEQPFRREPLEAYVKRMAAQVKHKAPVFIGLSFGGVIGAEMSKLFPGSTLILISTIASTKELAWYSRLGGFIRLNRVIPGQAMKLPNPFIRWFFSVSPGHDRALFDAILRDSDPVFLFWALDALLHWKGNGHHRLHHIHGKLDRLIPYQYTSADILIPDGGHFMIVSHGAEISRILLDILSKLNA